MKYPKYRIGDQVKIQSFGAQTEVEEGTIMDLKETKNGVNYTIQTERVRNEKRWEDEIVGKV